MKLSGLFTLAGAMLFISCSGDVLKPEGEIVETTIDVPTVDGIAISSGMTLQLDSNLPDGKAVIRTHANIQPYIKYRQPGNQVVFYVDAKRVKDLDVTISVSSASYTSFTASGGSEIESEELLVREHVSVGLSGGSRARMALDCSALTSDCSGGSEFYISGQGENAQLVCSGGSDFWGYDFSVSEAEVEVSGGSRLEITVTETLTGNNSGGSEILYKGTPQTVIVQSSGGSTISRN